MSASVSETSRQAYLQLKESGYIDTRREQVKYVLNNFAPESGLTANELLSLLKELGEPITEGNNPSITTRLSELAKMGVANRAGVRTCTVTNMMIQAWTPTFLEAKALEKRVSKDQVIAELRAEIADLRAMLEEALELKGSASQS